MSLASDYAAAVVVERLADDTRNTNLAALKPPDFDSRQIHATVTNEGQMAIRGEGVVDPAAARAFGRWIRQTFGEQV